MYVSQQTITAEFPTDNQRHLPAMGQEEGMSRDVHLAVSSTVELAYDTTVQKNHPTESVNPQICEREF